MKAYELIDRVGWCQGHEAVDENMLPVSSLSPFAVGYCIFGALKKCYGNKDEYVAKSDAVKRRLWIRYKFYYTLSGRVVSFVMWNDESGRTKEEVVGLLKEADV